MIPNAQIGSSERTQTARGRRPHGFVGEEERVNNSHVNGTICQLRRGWMH